MTDEQRSRIAFDEWWEEHGADLVPNEGFITARQIALTIRDTARAAWRQGACYAMTSNLTPFDSLTMDHLSLPVQIKRSFRATPRQEGDDSSQIEALFYEWLNEAAKGFNAFDPKALFRLCRAAYKRGGVDVLNISTSEGIDDCDFDDFCF